MMKYEFVESLYSSLDYTEIGEQQNVVVKGWNHDDKVKDFILNELEEHYGKKLSLTMVDKKLMGYKSSRFYEGNDARDEGYRCWIETDAYRKGLGKCIVYIFILKEVKDV